MADNDYSSVKLYAEHEPDPPPDVNHPRPETVEVGAGFVVVGVEVEGVRVPLARVKAGKITQQIEEAKKSKSSTKTASE